MDMRYPIFAKALTARGDIASTMSLFNCKRTQAIQYRLGRALPKAERLLRHPELLEAARADIASGTALLVAA